MEFEHVANVLCLEFANTLIDWRDPGDDHLEDPTVAMAWAGSLDLDVARPPTGAQLAATRETRALIDRVFRPIAAGDHPVPDDVDALRVRYAVAVDRAGLERHDHTYRLTWPAGDAARTWTDVEDHVVASAIDLLRHGPLARVGACPQCHWLFLDTSRNGRRRWCSMAACGGRDKARRWYAEHSPSTRSEPSG